MVLCNLCEKPLINCSVIWLDRGPAHWGCWVDMVIRAGYTEPKEFNPNGIHTPYADAMTGVLLTPRQSLNRFNKRQFRTMLMDTNYYPPGHSGKPEKRPHHAGEGIINYVIPDK